MFMPMNIFRIFVVIVIALSVGCSFIVEHRELVGTYKAVYPYGVETLILRDNGALKQTIKLDDRDTILENDGTWEVSYVEGRTYLELSHYIALDNLGQQRVSLEPTSFTGHPIKWGRSISWDIFPDGGIEMVKQ